MNPETFYCVDCKQTNPVQTNGGTGYATIRDTDEKVCYLCMAERDRKAMVETGNSRNLPLYIARHEGGIYYVSNWCGTLRFSITRNSFSHHNIGRTRHDAWFVGPDGYVWHGYQIGDWNQIFHARRTQQKAGVHANG